MIAIVGAGITGLAAAYYAHKANPSVPITLFEAADRPGGKLRTIQREGYTMEAGPDSFLTRKPWALELARELDIALIGTNDHKRNIYVVKEGELLPMPEGLRLTVPTKPAPFLASPVLSMKGKMRALREPFIPAREGDEDESIGAFVRRRFGEEMLRTIAEPMMAGLFVADADDLSLRATFPQYARMEREHGSLIKAHKARAAGSQPAPDGLTMFVTPKGGTQVFVDTLAQTVTLFADIRTHTAVAVISGEGPYTLRLSDGSTHTATAVIVTTPAYTAAHLTEPISAELSDLLRSIPYSSTVTVSLGYDAADFGHPLDGFGFVVPKHEETGLIAATWMSTKFDHRAPAGKVYLRAFLGEEVVDFDDHSLVRLAHAQLRFLMGFTPTEPETSAVFRWKRGSPVYTVGHVGRVARIETLCPPGLFVAGNAYRGVGIPDSVKQGKAAGEAAAQLVGA